MYRNFISKLIGLTLIGLLMCAHSWAQWPTSVSFADVNEHTIRVKLKAESLAKFDSKIARKSATGVVEFGRSDVDNLNKQFSVKNWTRVFPYSAKFEDRHQKHGLHLWYELKFEGDVSSIEVAKAYKQISDFSIVKPVLKKSLPKEQFQKVEKTTASTSSVFNDPMLPYQWHYNNTGQSGGTAGADINLFEAWSQSYGSSNVIVAITDGGVDVNHEDLKDNLWVNEAELNGVDGVDDDGNGYVDDIHGVNFALNTGNIEPDNHGSHVAGTIAAVNNNGIGVSGVAGGSGQGDGVRVMSCETFTNYGNTGFAQSYIYAADNGAVISQNSWGYTSPGYYEQEVLDAIDYFIEEAGNYAGSPMKGGIVIFAAGNDGRDDSYYPGYYEPVFSVASTNHNDVKSWYSNYGTWVEASAPGGETNSVSNQGVLSTLAYNSYGYYQGTSMACPHMSGIAALVISKANGNITNQELWDILVESTDNIEALNPTYQGKLGSGRIDAKLALDKVSSVGNLTFQPGSLTFNLKQGETTSQVLKLVNTSSDEIDFSLTSANAWVTLDVTDGTVAAGSVTNIEVMINATGLTSGVYESHISIEANGGSIIPVRLDLLGDPNLIQPSNIDYGTVYVGMDKTMYVEVINSQYGILEISDITVDNADFTITNTSLTLPPYGNDFIEVKFSPSVGGSRTGMMTIVSNDPDTSQMTVNLTGIGNANTPPTASLSVTEIQVNQLEAGADTVTMTLTNTGGELLNYSFGYYDPNISVNQLSRVGRFTNYEPQKGEESVQKGFPVQYGYGNDGQLNGYRWVDSNENVGFNYEWNDISTTGSARSMSDDSYFQLNLNNFSFPYYGQNYSSVYICSNGFLNFQSGYSNTGGSALPNMGTPNTVIAPYWVDLLYTTVYYQEFADRLVIQYNSKYFSDTSLDAIFQVVLYADGNIKFFYNKIDRPTSGTVGIENEDGSKGMTVVYNNTYLQNGLGVLITQDDLITSVTPGAGTLSVGESTTVALAYNTINTFELGGYSERIIQLYSNDPVNETRNIPFLVKYGGVFLNASPEEIKTQAFLGYSFEDSVLLENTGYADISITNIATDITGLIFDQTSFTLGDKERKAIIMSLDPQTLGTLTGNITFNTSDTTQATVTIPVTIEVVNAPSGEVSVDSLSMTLYQGQVDSLTFELTNLSSTANLVYEVSVHELGTLENIKTLVSRYEIQRVKKESDHKSFVVEQYHVDKPQTVFVNPASTSGMHVAVLAADFDGNRQYFTERLQEFSDFESVSHFDLSTWTPDLEALMLFDAVLVYSADNFNDREALGDVLADYYDLGGGVVTGLYEMITSSDYPEVTIGGRWENENYYLYERGNYQRVGASLDMSFDATHPVMQGVGPFTLYTSPGTGATNGAEVLASFDNGLPAVLVKDRLVSLGIYPLDISWFSEGIQLVINALHYSGKDKKWLSVLPKSGTVSPTVSNELNAIFNGSALAPGIYELEAKIATNIPDVQSFSLPVKMTVDAAPVMLVSTPYFENFGSQYVDSIYVKAISIKNLGGAYLDVNLSTTLEDFYLEQTAISVAPYTERYVNVYFQPRSEGRKDALLEITSNAYNLSSLSLNMFGSGVANSSYSVDKSSIDLEMTIGDAETEQLVLKNNGQSEVDYVLNVVGKNAVVNTAEGNEPIIVKNNEGQIILMKREVSNKSPMYVDYGFDLLVLTTAPYEYQTYIWEDLWQAGDFKTMSIERINNYIPPLSTIQKYDAVLLFGYGSNSIYSKTELGNYLYQYVQEGGNVVTASDYNSGYTYSVLGGAWETNGYNLYEPASFNSPGIQGLGEVVVTDHPIMEEVDTLLSTYNTRRQNISTLITGTSVVARWADNLPLVLEKEIDGHRLIHLNFMPGTGVWDESTTDGTRMLANAIKYVNVANGGTDVDWLSASSYEGTLAVGDSALIDLTFSADTLAEGLYNADIKYYTYDQDVYRYKGSIPVSLNLLGTPNLETVSQVDFGNLLKTHETSQKLTLKNTGNGKLILDSLQISNDSLVTVKGFADGMLLEVGAEKVITVNYNAVETGMVSEYLKIFSNDPDSVWEVALTAIVLPVGELAPIDTTDVSVAYGETTTFTLPIVNQGEASTEVYFSRYYAEEKLSALQTKNNVSPIQFGNVPVKGEKDERVGHVVQNGMGSDNFGYTFIDSDEEGGPAFVWTDITTDGTRLTLGDDQAAMVSLPWEFELYGFRYDKVYVSSNGYLTFNENQGISPINQQLPSTTAPNNVIAGFWKDLNPSTGSVHYKQLEDRIIVQYTDVADFEGTGLFTFQIVLVKNGNIEFKYLQMSGNTTDATVGIENENGTEGLQTAFNTIYIHNEMAVMVFAPHSLVSPEVSHFTLAAGDSAEVMFTVDATSSVVAGQYMESLGLSTNNLTQDVTVPVRVTVTGGEPNLKMYEERLTFDETFVGNTSIIPVAIYNTGTGYMDMPQVQAMSDDYFVVFSDDVSSLQGMKKEALLELDSIVTVAPKNWKRGAVVFAPLSEGTLSDTLTFENAIGQTHQIAVSGVGVMPTIVLRTDTNLLTDTLAVNTTATKSFVVTNEGDSPLNYSLSVRKSEFIELHLPPAERDATPNSNISHQVGRVPAGMLGQNITSEPSKYFETSEEVAYGFVYDYNADREYLGEFALANPNDVREITGSKGIGSGFHNAGAYILDFTSPYFIEITNNGEVIKTVVSTGEVIFLGNVSVAATGMTYDITTGICYIVSQTGLYTFNPNTLETQYIGLVNNNYIMIDVAIAGDGKLYAFEIVNDIFLEIDKETAEATEIGYIGFNSNYGQGMGYDPVSDKLFMAVYDIGSGTHQLRVVDTQTGNTAFVDYIGENGQGKQFGWIDFVIDGLTYLSFDPKSGSIAPGASENITVSFDATDLLNGDYKADIVISSNDQVNPIQTVKTVLQVYGNEAELMLSDSLLDFGHVHIEQGSEKTFFIENTGKASVMIDSIQVSNHENVFTVSVMDSLVSIGDTLSVKVGFNPEYSISYEETLTIYSAYGTQEVSLFGTGYGVNTAPEIVGDVANLSIDLAQGSVVFGYEGVFKDPDLDELTYEVVVADTEIVNLREVTSTSIYVDPLLVGSTTLTITVSDGDKTSTVDVFVEVYDSTPLGIDNEISKSLNVVAYPNPTAGLSTVEFTLIQKMNITLEVINTGGIKVQTYQLGDINAGTHQYDVDLSNLPSGIYLYKIMNNGTSLKTVKVMVQ
ncbi:S8 family serine peptidase [Limibacter armeniacum]|uniref:Ig-like domain-containing protein n=1 Tax=Limibacter armeniacum TaxID=466084 RepID=UPI002FE553EB